jgi:hypothetical protein
MSEELQQVRTKLFAEKWIIVELGKGGSVF